MSFHASYIGHKDRNAKHPDKPIKMINTNGGCLMTIEEATELRDALTHYIDWANRQEKRK